MFGRSYRYGGSHTQQLIFVGLALLFLVAYFVGRDACARKVATTYQHVAQPKDRSPRAGTKAGHDAGPPRAPPSPKNDAGDDGW